MSDMSYNSQIKILAFIIVSVFALGAVAACTDEAYADEGDKTSLEGAIITFIIDGEEKTELELTYTGEKLEPVVKVKVEGVDTELTLDGSYTVIYTNNTFPGTATAVVEGIDDYTGIATKTFTITAKNISSADVTLDQYAKKTYTGDEIKPGVTKVVIDGETLVAGTDYTVAYENNINAGTATVKVTGKGNYKGTATETFTITAKNISSAEVTIVDKEYTGNTITTDDLDITVALEGFGVLTEDDYTVTFTNSTNAGKYTVTVNGKDNFTGEAIGKFTILKAPLADDDVVIKFADEDTALTYTGAAYKPTVTVTVTIDGEVSTLTSGNDYTVTYENNINAGNATATVTLKNYNVEEELTFAIDKATSDGVTVTLGTGPYVYNGKVHKPEVTVKLDGTVLTHEGAYTVHYSDQVDVGTVKVLVTSNNFEGEYEATFNIAEADLPTDVKVIVEECVYTGSALEPDVIVKIDGKVISSNLYTLTYINNIKAGENTAEVNVDFTNYNSFAQVYFTILAKDISSAEVTLESMNLTYTGGEIESGVTKVVIDGALVAGTYYTVTYENNINAGTATVKVDGTGNFKGTATETFTIAKAALPDGGINVAVNVNYGADPVVTSVDVGTDVDIDADLYTVNYVGGVSTGSEVTLTIGFANYNGTVTKTFIITKAELTKDDIVITISRGATYDRQIKDIVVKLKDGTPVSNDNEDNVYYTTTHEEFKNAGEYTIKVVIKEDIGNYFASASEGVAATFKITAYSLDNSSISYISNFNYDGNEKRPEVALAGLPALEKGTDYYVYYADNENAGTATVTVKGIGNYSGETTRTFKILPKNMSSADVTLGSAELTYTGTKIVTGVTNVKIGDDTLDSDTDYTVTYENNTNAGTATVKVAGKGNYTGIATKTFTILAKDISSAEVTLESMDLTYTGNEIEPGVESVVLGEYTITYNVTYENNTNAGTATVKVAGTGNFKGTATKTFTIAKAALPEVDVTVEDCAFTGSELTPEVTVMFDGVTLADTDYTVVYVDNIEAGTGKVFVTFKNYTGSVKETFSIKVLLTDYDVTVALGGGSDFAYTGAAHKPTVTVTVTIDGGDKVLTSGNDYTVTYENNINAGTATVKVTGKGNYTGTVEETFEITKAALILGEDEEINVIIEEGSVYDGTPKTPDITVVSDKYTFTSDDYTVKYVSNTSAGTAKAIVTFNNYNKTVVGEFTIAKAPLIIIAENKTITFGDDEPDYTVKYVGFVGDDDKSVLVGDLIFTTDYDKDSYDSKVGIGLSGTMTSSNYDIAYQDGTLTVNKESAESNTLLFAGIVIAIVVIASIAVVAVRRQ